MRYLLLILLLVFGCEDTPVASSNEIDVDWILVRDPGFQNPYINDVMDTTSVNLGYHFYYTESAIIIPNGNLEIPGMPNLDFITVIEDSTYLSFTYNGEDFTYNISDLVDVLDYLSISSYSTRIIYNQDMDYLTLLDNTYFFMGGLDVSEPSEVIDYR